jgi:hypothetical protein
LIILNSKPALGAYNGPAAYNPYATVYHPGAVAGYDKWFQNINIGTFDQSSGTVAYVVDPRFSANEEGGQEALRIVQQFVPEATLVSHIWPSQLAGQPESYDVRLPNGTVLDGGLVLSAYYHEGYGANEGGDAMVEEACGLWPRSGTVSG